MISLIVILALIVLLTVWGLKTKYPLAFQMCFILAIVAGFRVWDQFGTQESLVASIVLICYSFAMAGAALLSMFREVEDENE